MRNTTIDLFKTISIFAVIIIHTHPFAIPGSESYSLIEVICNQLSRFAVPFFFLVSGYLWGNKLQNSTYSLQQLLPRLKQLTLVYCIWCGLYISLSFDITALHQYGYFKVTYWKLYDVWQHPIESLFAGTKTHLWFLPALICSQIFVLCLHKIQHKGLIPICLIIYLLGISGGAYKSTAIGITLPFDPRNGIFFASLFIALGIFIKQQHISIKSNQAWLLFLGGAIGQIGEIYWLWRAGYIDPVQVDFVFSTLPFGLAALFLALSYQNNDFPRISAMGQLTLGIYLVHMFFVELFRPLQTMLPALLYAMLIPLTVYLCALYITLFFQKRPLLKQAFG